MSFLCKSAILIPNLTSPDPHSLMVTHHRLDDASGHFYRNTGAGTCRALGSYTALCCDWRDLEAMGWSSGAVVGKGRAEGEWGVGIGREAPWSGCMGRREGVCRG